MTKPDDGRDPNRTEKHGRAAPYISKGAHATPSEESELVFDSSISRKAEKSSLFTAVVNFAYKISILLLVASFILVAFGAYIEYSSNKEVLNAVFSRISLIEDEIREINDKAESYPSNDFSFHVVFKNVVPEKVIQYSKICDSMRGHFEIISNGTASDAICSR